MLLRMESKKFLMSKKKCGFVSITGLPNAGKSTLINKLVNDKISIISHKVQTTQQSIRGILNFKECQIVFIDTPGIIQTKKFNDRRMSKAIFDSTNSADLNLLIVDISRNINEKNIKILRRIISSSEKNFLVINKIDKVERKDILKVVNFFNTSFKFNETVMISALKKDGLKKLLELITLNIPLRNWIFLDNETSDQKNEFLFSEITREKIFQLINKEIPYDIKIETLIDDLNINQNIYVKKSSHKPIIIGKNGNKIKEIGIRARKDIEKKLKKKIFLNLQVKLKNFLK